jgi:hypothetical protein
MKKLLKENKYLVMVFLAAAGFFTYRKFFITPKVIQDASLDNSVLTQQLPGGGSTLSIAQLNA